MISDKDMLNIKMMAIRLCGHISQANYGRMRHTFHCQLQLYTLWKLQARLAALSGVSATVHDRCRNNCMAFTGDFKNSTHCHRCGKARYDADGKAFAQWETIPLAARLCALYLDKKTAKFMAYRHKFQPGEEHISDIFDSATYNNLKQENIVIDGVDTGRRYFQGKHDLAFSLLGDGVQIFEHGHRGSDTCWPIILQNLNLPPSECCKLQNVLPLTIIPGPQQPKDFNSFFHPFVEEILQLAGPGIPAYNAYTKTHFQLRASPLFVCGYMQAIKHFGGMKGPNAKVPCHACRIVGVYDPIRKTYYVPLVRPIDTGQPVDHLDSYKACNLPLCTSEGIQRQTE